MSLDTQKLIHRYLDDLLTNNEQSELEYRVKSDRGFARQFATATLLHDRLFNERAGFSHDVSEEAIDRLPVVAWTKFRIQAVFGIVAAAGFFLVAVFVIWKSIDANSVIAAESELGRIIASAGTEDHLTFLINVEEKSSLPASRKRLSPGVRPPKPSIDQAVLHVRGANQFVLERKLANGQKFVTGCNGKISWAISPDGPVRVSTDLNRFNRDVPGHENAMPLNNLLAGLEQLRVAYQVHAIPLESVGEINDSSTDSTRLLVAVKKRGFRGPKRVEISFSALSGKIYQMRILDMPYGEDRLTLRMTLVEEQSHKAVFFEHESHHDHDRQVVLEE